MNEPMQARSSETRRAAVYRLFAADGALLYIGSAYDPEERCKGHHGKAWWPLVVSRTEEWHEGRVSAYIAEFEQVRAEQPPHNVMGTSRYVPPNTPGMRRRNSLNGIRARAQRDADRARADTWDEARKAGHPMPEVFRLGDLARIEVLEASGAWAAEVARLRARHAVTYGPS